MAEAPRDTKHRSSITGKLVAQKQPEEVRFDFTVGFDLLKQCGANSCFDRALGKVIECHPLVVRCIVLQMCYFAMLLRVTKHCIITLQGDTTTRQARHRDGGTLTAQKLLQRITGSSWATMQAASSGQLNIGIIGCGVVGSQILTGLLDTKLFHVTSFKVSTRQPANLGHFTARGIQVFNNNQLASEGADLLIIAVLPAHLPEVARSIAGKVKESCLIASCVCGVSSARLSTMFKHEQCVATRIDVAAISSFSSTMTEEGASRDPLSQKNFHRLCRLACPFSPPHEHHLTTLLNALIDTIPRSVSPQVVISTVFLSLVSLSSAATAITAVFNRHNIPPPAKGASLAKWGGLNGLGSFLGETGSQALLERAQHHFLVLGGAATSDQDEICMRGRTDFVLPQDGTGESAVASIAASPKPKRTPSMAE